VLSALLRALVILVGAITAFWWFGMAGTS